MQPSPFLSAPFRPRVRRFVLLLAFLFLALLLRVSWPHNQAGVPDTGLSKLSPAPVAALAAMAPMTDTFNFTGAMQTFIVPAGVTSISIEAFGAGGGTGATGGMSVSGGSGGKGAKATGTLAVTPGQVLNIFVGGAGVTPTGGFNGGANGGTQNAGGGGGASDVRVGGTAEANRVITAGGGGGGGRGGCDEGTAATGGIGGAGGNGGIAGGVGTSGNDSPTTGGVAGGGQGGNFGSLQGAFGAKGVGCAFAFGQDGSATVNGTGAAGGAGQSCCCGSQNSLPGGGGGSSFVGGVTAGAVTAGVQMGNGLVTITYEAGIPPTLNVQAGGRPNNAGIGDPAVCLDPGGLVGINATLTNNGAAAAATFTATLPGGLTAVAGTCTADVNPGGCTIAANGGSVSWNGNLAAGQTVNIVYRARIAANAGVGSTFTINNTATVGGVVANLDYTFTLNCPLTNTRVSDQKAGSVLVFPYYTSTIGGGSDTRMTISNISNAASTVANQAYVHLFFIDGTTCQQADLFLCLTPNASFSFKASDYDPGNTGYLLAVAVDRNGVPVQNNVLIGNAFVTTPTLADNYGAESFWANTFAVATVSGNTATLFFDQTGYDAVPKQFVAEIQSPLDAAGQQVVTAGLSGDLTASTITGAAQVGTGQAYNEKEVFGSFNAWLTGMCQARGTISTASPRVPNGLGNLIKTGQAGYLKFNVGGAVGLLLTPRTATWKGIRTLHKTQTVATTLTIPLFVPVC